MKAYITMRKGRVAVTLAGFLTLAAFQATRPASAEEVAAFGAITGLIRNPASVPVAGATITITDLHSGSLRATVSGSDGLYSFADVVPGVFSLRWEAVNLAGEFAGRVQVTGGRATRMDIAMPPVLVSSTAAPASIPSVEPHSPPRLRRRAAVPNAQTMYGPQGGLLARWLRGESVGWRDLTAPQVRAAGSEVASLDAPPASAFNPAADDVPAPASLVQEPAALAATGTPAAPKKIDPFSDADWTWLNGQARTKDSPLDSKYFSGEFRADTHFGLDFNQPKDHTMGGSSELFRSGEVQTEELALGGDFHVDNVRGRVLYLVGLFSTTTPRNDASAAVGQWDVRNAYRYVSEAWGGYHFNLNYGLNVDAGIFVSYVGLFSYHNFDNWAYQPSYVSSNTPWFFNGVRVQWFPTAHLKIEPWFINGWQSYNKFNSHPGLGGQLRWSPKPWLNVLSNNYGYGTDTLNVPKRQRYHTDNSVEVKYYENAKTLVDRMAFTFTGDLGCESGGGVSCTGKGAPKQAFLGYMAYNRFWLKKDLFGITLGGGQINNPGRYLALVLPVNGADAISGTPYFTGNPGDKFKAWDTTATFDYMPRQYITFRTEFGYRHANVPYFTGRRGVTPPGGNNGSPSQYVCNDGTPSASGIVGETVVSGRLISARVRRLFLGQSWSSSNPFNRAGSGILATRLLAPYY